MEVKAPLPTEHVVRAALHVASVLDDRGSTVAATHDSYWRHATGGVFSPGDLEQGERLLVHCGLVAERDGRLHPSPELTNLLRGAAEDAVSVVAAKALTSGVLLSGVDPLAIADHPNVIGLVPDADRRQQLLLALGRRWDDAQRQLIGAIGEEVVTNAARDELNTLGHTDLAGRVRRVSLVSDELGYDISAPRIAGPSRLLEVKATTVAASEMIVVHISRNEADVGLRFADQWALVICRVLSAGERSGEIVGWCTAGVLEPLWPVDTELGRWNAATLEVGLDLLEPGLPRPAL